MLDLLEQLRDRYPQQEYSVIEKAFDYAKKAHTGQKRASGEDYFTHPCAVAKILLDLGLDASTISAAFLHDVIEDTSISESDIKNDFGEEILQLVQGVTKLEKIEFHSKEEEQAENFRKIFVAMAKDIRVIIIKLADRLHNMRSLNYLSKERQIRMAKETIDIYAPLAGRLGISKIKCELEDLSLKYLDPEAFEFLIVNINQKIAERNELVNRFVSEINQILESSNIEGEVFGRAKHFYSIYRKMKNQNKTLEQIYDLTAIRVIVKSIDECYEILGKIHHKWSPIPLRIKDYIATPKPNMYQSLHTTVVTNFGQIFEVQIRTYDMNRAAEFGIAAHWKYKENIKDEKDDDFEKRLSWIREVMEWQGGLKDSKEFINTLKGDIYSSEVLVFTPNGDVISLPKESTPLDFAYSIHSAVGNKCVGAKVNGKMVPLNSTLQLGDLVEIITSKNSKGPSWDWLKIVKSSSARVKIRQFFKRELKEENIKTGKSMLENEARAKGYQLSEILTEEAFLKLSARLSFANQEEMFASVGYGAVTTNQVLLKLIDYFRKESKQPVVRTGNVKSSSKSGVVVKGMSDLLVRYAGCCNPVPGDEIIGFISRGKGVTIHRADCPNMREVEPDRFIEVSWSGDAINTFNASIKVLSDTQASALSAVSAVTSAMNLTITAVNGRLDQKSKKAILDVNIKLNSKQDLETLINKLKQNEKIIDVYRVTT